MHFPLKIDPKYGQADADTDLFLYNFAEPKEVGLVVEVGANDEYAANVLADNGYNVLGIDLRPYLQEVPCNYPRWVGDFCRLCEPLSNVGCVFSLSAIEHFGLMTYGDVDSDNPYYDVIACHLIWRALRLGGVFYITVPYGRNHLTNGIHWRVYNDQSFRERIVQRFHIEEQLFFTSGPAVLYGEETPPYCRVDQAEADRYSGDPPHVTVLAKLRKVDH